MVWTDPDGVVLDAFLNQFTAYSDRRMKGRFNRLQLLKKRGELQYYTWSCRGSYGHTVERTLLGDGTLETALVLFQENFNAGTESNWLERKHWVSSGSQYPYTIIQQCHLEDGRPGLSHSDGLLWEILGPSNNVLGPCEELPKRVQELVRFILTTSHSEKTLLEMGYDATRLPPERLAWSTLTSAFEQLKTLRDMLHDSNVLQKSDCGFQYWALQWTEQFYTYIPPILRMW